MGRHYDDAIREYRSVLAVHPDYTERVGLGFALIVRIRPMRRLPNWRKRLR